MTKDHNAGGLVLSNHDYGWDLSVIRLISGEMFYRDERMAEMSLISLVKSMFAAVQE